MDMQKILKKFKKQIEKEIGPDAIVLMAIHDGAHDGSTAFSLLKPKKCNPLFSSVGALCVATIFGVYKSLSAITDSKENAKAMIIQILEDAESLDEHCSEITDKEELN